MRWNRSWQHCSFVWPSTFQRLLASVRFHLEDSDEYNAATCRRILHFAWTPTREDEHHANAKDTASSHDVTEIALWETWQRWCCGRWCLWSPKIKFEWMRMDWAQKFNRKKRNLHDPVIVCVTNGRVAVAADFIPRFCQGCSDRMRVKIASLNWTTAWVMFTSFRMNQTHNIAAIQELDILVINFRLFLWVKRSNITWSRMCSMMKLLFSSLWWYAVTCCCSEPLGYVWMWEWSSPPAYALFFNVTSDP